MAIVSLKNSTLTNPAKDFSFQGVTGAAPVTPVPVFVEATPSSYTASITGYDPKFTYTVSASVGTAVRTDENVTVSGLSELQSSTLTVTAANPDATKGLSLSASGSFASLERPSDFESIATATATQGSTLISFTNIPQTYAHLQVRFIMSSADSTTGLTLPLTVRPNGVSTTNYASHWLLGNGSAASAGSATSGTTAGRIVAITMPNDTYYTNMRSAGIVDFLDYSTTTKTKTVRYFSGSDTNLSSSSFGVALGSFFLTNSTSAISSIEFGSPTGSGFVAGSTFSLYGIKAP